MHGRNSSALCRFIIENNGVGTRVEDCAGVVLVWTSPDGMWNSVSRRVSRWFHPANDQEDDWPVPEYVIAEEGSTSSAAISFRRETNLAIVASGVGCRSGLFEGDPHRRIVG
jgi:hypothetical protein